METLNRKNRYFLEVMFGIDFERIILSSSGSDTDSYHNFNDAINYLKSASKDLDYLDRQIEDEGHQSMISDINSTVDDALRQIEDIDEKTQNLQFKYEESVGVLEYLFSLITIDIIEENELIGKVYIDAIKNKDNILNELVLIDRNVKE